MLCSVLERYLRRCRAICLFASLLEFLFGCQYYGVKWEFHVAVESYVMFPRDHFVGRLEIVRTTPYMKMRCHPDTAPLSLWFYNRKTSNA